jgi:hypothetical protein
MIMGKNVSLWFLQTNRPASRPHSTTGTLSPLPNKRTSKKGKITGKIFQELRSSFLFSEEMLELFSPTETLASLRIALMPTREKPPLELDQLPKLRFTLKPEQQDLTLNKQVSSKTWPSKLKLSRHRLKSSVINRSSGRVKRSEAVRLPSSKN